MVYVHGLLTRLKEQKGLTNGIIVYNLVFIYYCIYILSLVYIVKGPQ